MVNLVVFAVFLKQRRGPIRDPAGDPPRLFRMLQRFRAMEGDVLPIGQRSGSDTRQRHHEDCSEHRHTLLMLPHHVAASAVVMR